MLETEFLTREEYLHLRRVWKKNYLRLSNDIHELKVATKMAAQGGWSAAQVLQSVRARMSNQAFDEMLNLEDLKEWSRVSVEAKRLEEDFQMFLSQRNH